MITNFEGITKELSETEKLLLEPLIEILEKTNKEKPILSRELESELKLVDVKFGGARLRKLTNFIRCNRIIPLIATSKGYYISNNREDIETEIKSLRERANSINNAADGLESFLNPQMKMQL